MKKMMYIIRGLLTLVVFIGNCLSVSGDSTAITQNTADLSSGMHSLVVSFDAPVFNGLNQSENLFKAILALIDDPKTEIGRRFDKIGAIYTTSHNLSGVQLAIFYSEDPVRVVDLITELLEQLKIIGTSYCSDEQCLDFARYLHQICPVIRPMEKRITVRTQGAFDSYREKVHTTASELTSIYDLSETDKVKETPPVLAHVLPTVFYIFRWDSIDSSSFFSAKFTGEQFKKEASEKSPVRYDLIFGENRIFLAVYVSGGEEEIFSCYNHFNNVKQSFLRQSSGSWQSFANAAAALQANDLRDSVKATMLNAWLTHWASETKTYSNKIAFVQPANIYESISMPAEWQHNLSYSKNLFPFFAAGNSSDNSETADIAIAIAASSTVILREIVSCLKNSQGISFPFTVELQNNKRVVICFHGTIGEISGKIARLRARILNYLFEKGLISELPGPLTIGVSGICRQPPFMLRGLLQQGWPPTTSDANPRPAELSEILSIPEFSAEGPEAGQRRLSILSSSSRGKAEILAILTSTGIQLRSLSFTD